MSLDEEVHLVFPLFRRRVCLFPAYITDHMTRGPASLGGGVCINPDQSSPPEYGQQAGGTHPTGMHTCSTEILQFSFLCCQEMNKMSNEGRKYTRYDKVDEWLLNQVVETHKS